MLANQWQQVTMVYNAANVRAYLYIDGVEKTSVAVTTVGSSSGVLKVADNYNVNHFNGLIDEVRIYSEALGSTQIEKLYAEGARERGLLAETDN